MHMILIVKDLKYLYIYRIYDDFWIAYIGHILILSQHFMGQDPFILGVFWRFQTWKKGLKLHLAH